ncbi:MAG: Hpt domain-containing protein [Nitrospirae bacterium]|nr:Hpt domain-containing protein [Nitrospirota bacterium]
MAVADSLRSSFKERANELLDEIEEAMLEFEKQPDDCELLWRSFRAMHTIKGSGAMFGFDDVSIVAHEVETLLRMAIDGELTFSRDVISVTLAAHDLICNMLNTSGDDNFERTEKSSRIVSCLKEIAQRRLGGR